MSGQYSTFWYFFHRAPIWLKANIKDIKAGSHICFWNHCYYKHAIVCHEWKADYPAYMGSGKMVIIAWKLTPPQKIIRETVHFRSFLSWRNVYVAVYSKTVCHDPDTVVKRAKSRIGETNYHVVKNYARAFPRWCVTGYGGVFTQTNPE